MIKKINIFLVLLLLFISISAVSAVDGNGSEIVSNEAIPDVPLEENIDYTADVLTVDESSSMVAAASHTITNDNYNQYFDSNGKLVSSKVNSGDTIKLDGSFSGKSFEFDKTINIVGTSKNKMSNSIITLTSGASGSSISNLNIENKKVETYGIFLNSASNCIIKDCIIKNTGKASYCICIANGANYNNVTNNDLKAYGVTYGHGTRSTPPFIVSGSHHNYIAYNHVESDDANGIYLSNYEGGPVKGGYSNFNMIYNNTVECNAEILPTSWTYNIQVMGNNNTIKANTVIRGYRGISTAGSGNIIIDNTIINIIGADYNHPGVETGGEYGIVGSYNSIIKNNKIIDSKIISTGAGISSIDNSIIENNWVNVTEKGRGIVAGGSNVVIKGNTIFTELGSGVYEKDEGSGLLVENNKITSSSGVGVLIEKLSSKRMPKNVTIVNNIISTNNKYAIDASGVQADSSEIDPSSNIIIGSSLINSPAGVIDTSKPTYIFKGKTHTITPTNIREFINDNGGLTAEINDGDILNFKGTFSNEVIYITKSVKITGKSPKFYNSTFKVTSGNVLIENLTIINKAAERVNAWGIFVNQAPGVRIMNNNISVSDPKAAYAIYILESSDIDILNNILISEGDYLTFTILSYACEDCNIINNQIKTIGTGEVYSFAPEKCIDGNELVIDGKSYCLDGNEVVIDGVHYCLDGQELSIDGVKYCLDGNEITIDGKSYCLDGNEVVIDGTRYCLDGNEVVIDGVHYCLDGNEFLINGVTYCLDGNELSIDGTRYCLDGNEITIDGKSYCLDGNEQTINGKSYCLDGNEVVIDGVHYCLDGNEVTIDGVKYCVDGNEYCMDGAHVVSEIYQTYGILLLYSSNNKISDNNVDVSSKLDKVHSTTGADNSTNSLVGIDVYFNSHNNTFLNNNIFVKSNDNYIYGMGVLGYNTGHKAPEGQGATNNIFEGNEITLEGPYFTTGLIVGSESEGTVLKDNIVNLKSGVSYGITLELSQMSNIENNVMTLNSEVIYGIEALSSNDNKIKGNEFKTTGKQVYGILISNGNANIIENNKIAANGNNAALTIKNLDSLTGGNAGIYLRSNSTKNQIKGNNITSTKGYSILVDNEAIENSIVDNYLVSEKGIGNKAVSNTKNNDVAANYKYIATASISSVNVPFLGTGVFKLTFDKSCNGAIVKFYDADNNYFAQGTVKNGVVSAKYKFDSSYGPAQYVFSAVFEKENYKMSTLPIKFVITKGNIVIKVNTALIQQGKTGSIVATILDDFGNPIKGATVEFYRVNSAGRLNPIGNATSNAKGIATLSYKVPSSIDFGSHQIDVKVNNVVNYNDDDASGTLKVYKTALITGAKNYSVYYGTTVKYKVRAFNLNGKAVGAGKYVYVYVDGKYVKKVKTDKKGYASYSAKLKVGTHTIKVTYNGYAVSKKITVKPTLIAKNVVKKKAKTTKFTVKLVSKKGKILKNKKITFKFKGKKYTAKTNKKGIATLSLKNLKVGKYTITSTYGGCTVKKTIQIKK